MNKLRELVESRALLLDFDGPVCAIFAGYSARRITRELVALLDSMRLAMPSDVRNEQDPLAVLRWTAMTYPAEVAAAENLLCEAELEAARTAEPTPFGREVILGARARGIPVAVVSNNSEPAIRAYLTSHGLAGDVEPIIGRPHSEPGRMKPDPGPVLAAVQALATTPSQCTLIGDSLTDIEAARAAGVGIVGYANRPWKVEAFADADAVVTSMRDIADALSPVSPLSPEGG